MIGPVQRSGRGAPSFVCDEKMASLGRKARGEDSREVEMSQGYWASTVTQRLSRRRALVASGGAALGAAFLAACGGDDNGSAKQGGEKASGLLFKPVDTSKQAAKGGVMQNFMAN